VLQGLLRRLEEEIVLRLKLGQKIAIDDIEMTLLATERSFRGTVYKFVYFNGGQIVECRFCWKELQALGAIILVEGNEKKMLTNFQ